MIRPVSEISIEQLNDRLRAIDQALLVKADSAAFDGDLKGKRLKNVARALESADGLNVALGDERYVRKNATGGSTTIVTSGGVGQVTLSVPGTLGIGGDQAPRLSLPEAKSVREILVVVKQAPVGAKIKVQLELLKTDGTRTAYATAEIAIGATRVSLTTGLADMPAGQDLILNVITVGTTFPGADLTVQVRF